MKTNNPKTALIQLTAVDSLSEIIAKIKSNIKKPEPTPIQLTAIIPIIMIAAFSGYLYSLSCDSEVESWNNATKTDVFTPLYDIGGSTTNGLFNAEGYLTFYEDYTTIQSKFEESLLGAKNIVSEWISAAIIGIFTLIPITYQGWDKSAATKNILNSLASLANLPIYILGGIWFIKDVKNKYNKNKQHTISTSNAENSLNKDQTTQQLNAVINKILSISSQDRNSLITSLTDNTAHDSSEFLKLLLSQEINIKAENNNTLYAKQTKTVIIYLSIFLVLYQNFGFTMVGGKAGYDFGTDIGMTGAAALVTSFIFGLCNLIPSLGYSKNGIDTIKAALNKQTPLVGQYARKLLPTANIFVLTLALFSGGTSGGVNRDGICLLQGITQEDEAALAACRASLLAWTSAILGNLGAALPYNAPQALLFNNRMFELFFERYGSSEQKQHIGLEKEIKYLANIFDKMSENDFTEISSSKQFKPCFKSLNV